MDWNGSLRIGLRALPFLAFHYFWVIIALIFCTIFPFVGLFFILWGLWDYRRRTKPIRQSQFTRPGSIKKIAIIGAGSSGLAGLKEAVEAGFEVVCYEQSDEIGGKWHYSDNPLGHSGIPRNHRLSVSKHSICFSDFPIPDEYPLFMSHEQVLAYLKSYVKNFELQKFIQFNTTVIQVDQVDSKWKIIHVPSISENNGGDQEADQVIEEYDAVIVANGHQSLGRWPTVPDEESFLGYIIHSHAYKEATTIDYDFCGKKVLVVGTNRTAMDIAVELSYSAGTKVLLSTTQPLPSILPKTVWGLSLDSIYWHRILMMMVPMRYLKLWWLKMRLFLAVFSGIRVNFQFTDTPPTARHAPPSRSPKDILNQKKKYPSNSPSYANERRGVCCIKRALLKSDERRYLNSIGLASLSSDCAHFHDGTSLAIDAVIYCTGYKLHFPFLEPDILQNEANDEISLFKNIWKPEGPHSLALVGLVPTTHPLIPISELQSRWIMQVWLGRCGLPTYELMLEEVREDLHKCRSHSPTYSTVTQMETVPFMEEIASQLGVIPCVWSCRNLLKELLFMPPFPASYRLDGPGAKITPATEILRRVWKQLYSH